MTSSMVGQLAQLREQFDRRFAEPEAVASTPGERLLGVRVGRAAAPFLLRLVDIARLSAMPRVVRVPTTIPSVLGMATERGRIIVVHQLAAVLGLDAVGSEPRWLLRLTGADIALAVEQHDGVLQAAASEWLSLADESIPLCLRALRLGDGVHPLIDSEALRDRLSPPPSSAKPLWSSP